MASLRPDTLAGEILDDPFRGAERRFYEACRALPDDWHVLYGVPWVCRRGPGRQVEGEADFVVIGPEIGFVVVEIKGGRVACDRGAWSSVDRRGQSHPIKNPFEQAQRCKYELLGFLQQKEPFKSAWLPAAHCVMFPDVGGGGLPMLAEAPREISLCADDMNRLDQALRSVATIGPNRKFLSTDLCRQLADALKPTFSMPGRWGLVVAQQQHIVERLTDDQMDVLNAVDCNARIGLTGPAGSGKTILGMRWLRKQVADGFTPLVVTPGGLLDHYYRAMIPEAGDNDFATYRRRGAAIPIERSARLAVLVDEAQEMDIEAWDVVEGLLKTHGQSRVLVIYDENQRLRPSGHYYLPDGLAIARLHRVIRNTRSIASESLKFFRGVVDKVEIAGPHGPSVRRTALTEFDRPAEVIAKIAIDLVRNEGFSYEDMVVLSAYGSTRQTLAHSADDSWDGSDFECLGVSFRAAGTQWSKATKHAFVSTGTVKSFRGMESHVVILCGFDKAVDRDFLEACYVGASRARSLLHIVASPATHARLTALGAVPGDRPAH